MSRERRWRQLVGRYGADAVGAIVAALRAGKLRPGQLYSVPIYHDDGCDELAGRGPCNCERQVGEPQRVAGPEEN